MRLIVLLLSFFPVFAATASNTGSTMGAFVVAPVQSVSCMGQGTSVALVASSDGGTTFIAGTWLVVIGNVTMADVELVRKSEPESCFSIREHSLQVLAPARLYSLDGRCLAMLKSHAIRDLATLPSAFIVRMNNGASFKVSVLSMAQP